MSIQAILLPVFAEVLLVFLLAVLMGRRRFAAVNAKAVRREDVVLGQKNWPPKAQAAANAYGNQFELPVLFFALVPLAIMTRGPGWRWTFLALVPLAIITRKADLLFVVLSWIFVASRYVHAGIYVTSNFLPARLGAFLFGVLILLVMWAVFAFRILAAPLPV